MAGGADTHKIEDSRVVRATRSAILVVAPDLEGEVWIPQSQVHDDSDVYDDEDNAGPGDLVVSGWLADQRGWR